VRVWEDEPRPQARIEIIPMIDVMMFLLVFFVLISINVIPATGLKTHLPTSATARADHEIANAIVTVTRDGTLQLDGRGVTLPDLGAQLQTLKQQKSGLKVIVKGDAEVELQRLIDVMDAVKAAGIDALSIAAKQKPR
jgi:biopolymer transport protein ExbD